MVKAKAAAADVRIPQNRDEAASMIAEFGAASREVQRIETDLKEALAVQKKASEDLARPHLDKALQIFRGLQLYCEANRAQLLGNTGTKTVDFGTGTVKWRWNPPKVRISGDAEDVITAIVQLAEEATTRGDADASNALLNFLRVKQEIDKEAMLKNPDLARTLPGVGIGRGGETFEVEPFGAEISEAAQ